MTAPTPAMPEEPKWVKHMRIATLDTIVPHESEYLAYVDALIAYATHLREEKLGTCNWTLDIDGAWQTTCGHAFCIEDGTPADNDMNFCCYCGKTLIAAIDAAKGEENAIERERGGI